MRVKPWKLHYIDITQYYIVTHGNECSAILACWTVMPSFLKYVLILLTFFFLTIDISFRIMFINEGMNCKRAKKVTLTFCSSSILNSLTETHCFFGVCSQILPVFCLFLGYSKMPPRPANKLTILISTCFSIFSVSISITLWNLSFFNII